MEDNTKKTPPFNVYCNGVNIATAPFDFTFVLNNNSPTGELFLGEVKMSPQHAKAFAHILLENVKKYEEIFGTIPEPPTQEKMEELQRQGLIRVEGNAQQ